ncbi:ABC transporter substrate-binding protein [Alkalicoccus urumqiensis]|uniref:Probable sugar-binding periplasmic protein n=2 Tax=Alkalicoccus urumqiensis TaxID=1548213 RepID=A0A2P6MLY8_ALKUR|nr:ABC transporter substrate-binding protein [Alkalicoccus urumqiensis]
MESIDPDAEPENAGTETENEPADDTGGNAEEPADENEAAENGENADGEASGGGEGELEIFSWWTGAGEEAGLLALIDQFESDNPDVSVVNAAVAGGAGTNAQAVLASRMQGNDPPGTFQIHAGAALNTGWVEAGRMEPITDIWEEEEWMDKFPEDLIDMITSDGEIYSVPVNIHRSNTMFFNQSIFDEYGLEAPTTFDEFYDVADQLEAEGIVPLALGDTESWTALHLFETILLGVLGPDSYNQLWSGELGFDSPEVAEAVEHFDRMLEYINDDHAARNWQDAAQMVAQGDAAMNVMGDWAAGYFATDLELEPNVDFGWAETPDTEGEFIIVSDTFGLPQDVDDPDTVRDFLTFLGSVEAQDTFNPLKGSIPARVDADPEQYNEYGQETIDDFQNASLAPSLAHNSAAPAGFVSQADQAVNIFVSSRNHEQLIDSLQTAQEENIQ